MWSIGQVREIDGSRLAGTNSTALHSVSPHHLAPPPAAHERSINECCDDADKTDLWDGRSTKGHSKRIGRGRGSSDAELEYFKRYLRLVWSLWTVPKSLLAMNIQLILMELYQAPRPRQRFPLLLEISFTFSVNWVNIP